jgi:hypothetical protein
VTENRILRGQIKGRLRLTDPERIRLATAARRLGRKALEEVAQRVRPETILGWQRRLIAKKFDGSKNREPDKDSKAGETQFFGGADIVAQKLAINSVIFNQRNGQHKSWYNNGRLNCSVSYATLPFIRRKNNNISENPHFAKRSRARTLLSVSATRKTNKHHAAYLWSRLSFLAVQAG